MAINRLWQAGWETASDEEVPNGTKDVRSTQKRTGLWSARVLPNDNQSFYVDISDTAQIRAGTGFFFSGFVNNDGEILVIHDGATRLLEIRTVIASNDIQLIVDGSQEDVTTDSPLANLSTWYHIGIDCKIDAAVGWVKV